MLFELYICVPDGGGHLEPKPRFPVSRMACRDSSEGNGTVGRPKKPPSKPGIRSSRKAQKTPPGPRLARLMTPYGKNPPARWSLTRDKRYSRAITRAENQERAQPHQLSFSHLFWSSPLNTCSPLRNDRAWDPYRDQLGYDIETAIKENRMTETEEGEVEVGEPHRRRRYIVDVICTSLHCRGS